MDELTEILEQGIAAKRQGNFQLAFEKITHASKLSPTDNRVFGNRFRLLIGMKKYEDALRDLLVLANFNQLEGVATNNPEVRLIVGQMMDRFKWENKTLMSSVFSSVKFDPGLIWLSLKNKPTLVDFIYRADNLTFYLGHAFVGMTQKILSYNKIPEINFKNLNYALLGKPRGEDLRGSSFDGLFLILGFMIGHMNVKPELKSKSEIVNYFINRKAPLNLEVSNYLEHIGKLSTVMPANDIEQMLKIMVHGIGEGIEKTFHTTVYRTEVINLKTFEDKGMMPIWTGLPEPELDEYNIFYLNRISFEIDEMDFVVMKNGQSSEHNDWDVENYISQSLGGDQVATGGAYQVGNKKYRICKFYYYE